MVTTIGSFLFWTCLLYWLHRGVHHVPVLKDFHMDHHKVVNKGGMGWHWSNLFLFNDTWKSTVDLWITEVVPTLVFSAVTGEWWIAVFYYVWAAFIQEGVEHNPDFDILWLTSGKWHMAHHRRSRYNFGVFIPLWDILFGTYAETPQSQ
jgi:sterol desaturase/sphingolipid hydroxylase (fatty acid hydroxylase superfamily)